MKTIQNSKLEFQTSNELHTSHLKGNCLRATMAVFSNDLFYIIFECIHFKFCYKFLLFYIYLLNIFRKIHIQDENLVTDAPQDDTNTSSNSILLCAKESLGVESDAATMTDERSLPLKAQIRTKKWYLNTNLNILK